LRSSHHAEERQSLLMEIETMKNTYPKQEGFQKRVYFARNALIQYAIDSHYDIFTRAFDDCFENFDGDAVVFALAERAKKDARNGDNLLLKGMKKVFGNNPDSWGQKDAKEQLSVFA
jgi:hypothetical protein